MAKSKFDISSKDSQASIVDPVKVSDFCFEEYLEYEQVLRGRCKRFTEVDLGVLVYRRMRVAEVFSSGCSDMQKSLEWQLGALKKSMDYPADVPNFLEPWYGIAALAGSFGMEYIWNPGQAPATKPVFFNIDDVLNYDIKPVRETPAGKHTLNMIEYFLDQTQGSLPMSCSDIQSPFNNSTLILDTTEFLTSLVLNPDKVLKFLDILADLMIDFYREQMSLIGSALVKPGHGFASAREFQGFGMSDDNIVMVSEDDYVNFIAPSFAKVGNAFGGPVLHSCGDFSNKTGVFNKIDNLRMVDAAFTAETDPNPNPCKPFADSSSENGIILNARMVGDVAVVEDCIRELWRPGMKILAVTYSQNPSEQKDAYDIIHQVCT